MCRSLTFLSLFLLNYGEAPTRTQLQLKLTEKEAAAGRVGLAEFIVDGFKIQESQ